LAHPQLRQLRTCHSPSSNSATPRPPLGGRGASWRSAARTPRLRPSASRPIGSRALCLDILRAPACRHTKRFAVNRLSGVKMTSARLAAVVSALLIAAPLASAQGVPIPRPAPKSRNEAARSQSPLPTDAAGRPIPIRLPESVPCDGSQRALVDRARIVSAPCGASPAISCRSVQTVAGR
jgi:hypothetical protein